MIRLIFQLAKFFYGKGHILSKLFLAFGLLLALVGPEVLADWALTLPLQLPLTLIWTCEECTRGDGKVRRSTTQRRAPWVSFHHFHHRHPLFQSQSPDSGYWLWWSTGFPHGSLHFFAASRNQLCGRAANWNKFRILFKCKTLFSDYTDPTTIANWISHALHVRVAVGGCVFVTVCFAY